MNYRQQLVYLVDDKFFEHAGAVIMGGTLARISSINEPPLESKCGLCGRYFLLEATAYSAFCTRPTKENRKKTCRDLGHRKTYADKVNNDPILLTYTKAYKAHYARYMKKRMTQAEFRVWADHAPELRAKAYSNELGFKEYEEAIKL